VQDSTLLLEVDQATRVVQTDSFEPLKWLSVLTAGKAKIPHGGFTNQRKEKWSQRILRFIRGNFFIPDARVGWVKHAVTSAAHLIRQEQIDTILISSPPHSSQLVGLQLKEMFPALKWIADLRDPWTDIYYYQEMSHLPFAKRKDQKLEINVLKNCSAVLVVSDSIRELFLAKDLSLERQKFHVIPNGFDRNDFPSDVIPPDDVFRITYVGTIADNYDPATFFSVMARIKQTMPDVNWRVRMVGSPSVTISTLIQVHGFEAHFEFIPHVSHADAVRYMCASSALLLLIPKTVHAKGILTGKLFEYLGSGIPVIGLGPADGDAAHILTETGAGKMFERDDEDTLCSYLTDLVCRWKQNTDLRHRCDVSTYERSHQAKQLAEVLNQLKSC
jgi:glycosyltransferase involved in cell wall biosynthesis